MKKTIDGRLKRLEIIVKGLVSSHKSQDRALKAVQGAVNRLAASQLGSADHWQSTNKSLARLNKKIARKTI